MIVPSRQHGTALSVFSVHSEQQLRLAPLCHCSVDKKCSWLARRYEGGYQRDWHEAIDLYKEVQPNDIKASWEILQQSL